MPKNATSIYSKFYIEREYEQVDLYGLLKAKYSVNKVMYPGSYVQVSPSFIFNYVVYIDSDKNAKKFFENRTEVQNYI